MLTEPGKHEYELPPHERLDLVLIGDWLLHEMPLAELLRLRDHDVEVYGAPVQAFPCYFALRGEHTLVLYPCPDREYDVRVSFWKRETI
jgi:hypothetical protein